MLCIINIGSDYMHSVGIDIIRTKRFEKEDTNFFEKIFTTNELEYIKKRRMNKETIAGLFCAKEAFLKAIKKGINNYPLKDIEISHNEENAPFIILHNELKDKESAKQHYEQLIDNYPTSIYTAQAKKNYRKL